jgi:phosphopantothenoylcysteine synthetase/decarboxylase
MADSPVVLLGVTGGIAAYKAAELLRGLQKAGMEVRVVMTRAATKFVGTMTFETLSGRAARGFAYHSRRRQPRGRHHGRCARHG